MLCIPDLHDCDSRHPVCLVGLACFFLVPGPCTENVTASTDFARSPCTHTGIANGFTCCYQHEYQHDKGTRSKQKPPRAAPICSTCLAERAHLLCIFLKIASKMRHTLNGQAHVRTKRGHGTECEARRACYYTTPEETSIVWNQAPLQGSRTTSSRGRIGP